MKAVIQAGGKGTRLLPYSLVLPKPLMPIGEWPVIESLLKWLRRNNIQQVFITIGYLGHLIRTAVGNGNQWGMEIIYSEEPEPLGTVGPLRLIAEHLDDTFIMLNGDLITDLNLRSLILFHHLHKGIITIATRMQSIATNLGIIKNFDNGSKRVKTFHEKPIIKFKVSMGIYCIEPCILELIPEGVPFGFDDLMYIMLDKNMPIYTYDHDGYWFDLGRTEDFLKAQKKFGKNE